MRRGCEGGFEDCARLAQALDDNGVKRANGGVDGQIFCREYGCSGVGMLGVIVPPTGPFSRLLS